MSSAALIPFVLLLICFVGLRFSLTTSSFIALLSGSFLTGTVFNGSLAVWHEALNRTFQIMIEIGLILLGAFLFLEVAKKTGIIRSLAQFIQEVSSNRVVQGILVIFPLEMMIEGSSGFGTPLLITAPVLQAMGFAPILCAVLPFLICVGIPFGALGTPVRFGFPGATDPTTGIFVLLLPILTIAPLLGAFLISNKLRIKEISWVFSLCTLYGVLAYLISKSGPEFVTLIPAFFTFLFGVISSRFLFKDQAQNKMKNFKGIALYGALLFCMWLGKQIFMDRLFSGTRIRIFNPGFVFLIFSFLLLKISQKHSLRSILAATFERSRRTLFVFFCMTFVVQQMRENGGIDSLTHSIPEFLLNKGAPILGWLGTLFVGTSTVSNLFISKAVDPIRFAAIGAGSAIGVQLAFQSLAAMRSTLNDQITEKELFFKIAPVSFAFLCFTTILYSLFYS